MFCDWQKLAECCLEYTSTKTLALLLINYRGNFFLTFTWFKKFCKKKKIFQGVHTGCSLWLLVTKNMSLSFSTPVFISACFLFIFFIPNILHHQFVIDREFEDHKESTSRRRVFDVFQMWAAVRRTKWWGRGLNSLRTCQELSSLLWFSICVPNQEDLWSPTTMLPGFITCSKYYVFFCLIAECCVLIKKMIAMELRLLRSDHQG